MEIRRSWILRGRAPGVAVQGEAMQIELKAPGTYRLKLKYDNQLAIFCFLFQLAPVQSGASTTAAGTVSVGTTSATVTRGFGARTARSRRRSAEVRCRASRTTRVKRVSRVKRAGGGRSSMSTTCRRCSWRIRSGWGGGILLTGCLCCIYSCPFTSSSQYPASPEFLLIV